MKKKVFLTIFVIIVAAVIWQWELINYGIMQGRGQMHIIMNSRPVEEYLADQNTPDSVKNKLEFIQEVRSFAIDNLGLNDTDNYTTMFDQQGKPLLWVVTGCKPYAFEPKTWTFPVVGEVPYKGYFIQEKASELEKEVIAEGYDAGIRTVGGWSTLGWFKDPILSNMLNRSYGDLANLIIHELVHATVFVKDSVNFNENLASFIGDQGARYFLEEMYGDSSVYLKDYLNELEDEQKFIDHILTGADNLDSLYLSFDDSTKEEMKLELKTEMISEIISNLDTLKLNRPSYLKRIKKRTVNNTYFMSFMRYRSKQLELDSLYREQFDNDLFKLIGFMKESHPFL